MNPDTGEYASEDAIARLAQDLKTTESDAARRLLGGPAVRVEGTEEEVARLSDAVTRDYRTLVREARKRGIYGPNRDLSKFG